MIGHRNGDATLDLWLRLARTQATNRTMRANIGGVEVEGPAREIALLVRAFTARPAGRTARKPRAPRRQSRSRQV